jgi:hypothetical protein
MNAVGIIAGLLISGLCVSCATSPAEPSIDKLQAIGREKFGHEQVAVAIIPGSRGPVNDAMVTGLSAAFGPSHLVRDTAAQLEKAHARRLDVLFYSRTPARLGKVIIASLERLPANSLSGMRIYAIDVDPAQIESAITKSGAQLVK